jgi:transposase
LAKGSRFKYNYVYELPLFLFGVAGVDGAPNGISVPRWSLSKPHLKGSRRLRKSIENLTSVTRVGLDLAKRVFQVHAVDATGEIVAARKAQAGGAAGSSPFSSSFRGVWRRWRHVPRRTIWGRTLIELGHEVKLIAPAHVKPYVRRNKNDAADAAAICEAAGRPGQRFVAVRSIDNEAALMRHRPRELLAGQRTEALNALRGHVAEIGIVAPQGA